MVIEPKVVRSILGFILHLTAPPVIRVAHGADQSNNIHSLALDRSQNVPKHGLSVSFRGYEKYGAEISYRNENARFLPSFLGRSLTFPHRLHGLLSLPTWSVISSNS